MSPTRTRLMLALTWIASIALCAPLLARGAEGGTLKQVQGEWAGQIKVMGQSLRVIVRLADERSTIDIPDQNAMDQPLSGVALQGQSIRFSIAGLPGDPTFSGNVAGDEIAGTFSQGGQNFPFTLTRASPSKPRRPQDPIPPFPYEIEPIRGQNGDVTLSGTLTRPRGPGPFPAVVLISGSGPQNRDSEILDHRPFHVLADALTRAGVIVARYDDRGVGESTGSREGATMRTFASDAGAVVSALKKRPDVSTIGLIGLSEGGQVAPMLAAGNRDVGFVVLMAAPGVSGDQLMVEQNRAIVIAKGARPAQADAVASAAQQVFAAAKRGEPQARVAELLRDLTKAQLGGDLPPHLEPGLAAQAQMLLSPWFREFLTSDPAVDLRRLSVPVLAINGSKDTQVIASQNLPAIADALKEGKNPDATVKELPGLNHLFQTANTGGIEEYGQINETISPVALDLITTWIRARFVKPAK